MTWMASTKLASVTEHWAASKVSWLPRYYPEMGARNALNFPGSMKYNCFYGQETTAQKIYKYLSKVGEFHDRSLTWTWHESRNVSWENHRIGRGLHRRTGYPAVSSVSDLVRSPVRLPVWPGYSPAPVQTGSVRHSKPRHYTFTEILEQDNNAALLPVLVYGALLVLPYLAPRSWTCAPLSNHSLPPTSIECFWHIFGGGLKWSIYHVDITGYVVGYLNWPRGTNKPRFVLCPLRVYHIILQTTKTVDRFQPIGIVTYLFTLSFTTGCLEKKCTQDILNKIYNFWWISHSFSRHHSQSMKSTWCNFHANRFAWVVLLEKNV